MCLHGVVLNLKKKHRDNFTFTLKCFYNHVMTYTYWSLLFSHYAGMDWLPRIK